LQSPKETVLLASASNAIIIGFNVRPERKAQELAEQDKVRHPPALDHLRTARRDQARHDRPARTNDQGNLSGKRRGARNLPHSEGGHDLPAVA